MLNLCSKTSLSNQIFSIPSVFETTAGALRQWHFLDVHLVFVMKYLSLKKVSDGQINISQLSTLLFFYKLSFEVKKLMRLNKTLKLKFILMFFGSVYPKCPSDTKPTNSTPILLVERLFKWSWALFCYFILWLAKPGSKTPCILLSEIEYWLEFVSTNPPFYPVLPTQVSNSYYLVVANSKKVVI